MTSPGLVIYGAGGHAKVVIDAALAGGRAVACVLDDRPPGKALLGIPVVAAASWKPSGPFEFVIAVGRNRIRKELYEKLGALGGRPSTVVHPRAVVSPFATIGAGSVIFAGAVINPDAMVGNNCVINTSANVDHDCRIGDHAQLCPGVALSGAVTIGPASFLGTAACVLPGVAVGADCLIGAGSLVNDPVPDGMVAYGVPARVIRRHEDAPKSAPH